MELYINDVLVVYLAGDGKSAGEQIVQVPQYILKSGLQTVKVKIYPLMDKNKKLEKFVFGKSVKFWHLELFSNSIIIKNFKIKTEFVILFC